MPDEQIAAPSTASAVAEPVGTKDLADYSPAEYQAFMKTGKMAHEQADPPTTGDSASPNASAPQGESASASEADTGTPKRKTAEDRKAVLAAEIQDLLKQRADLRKEVAAPRQPDAKPAEPSPALKTEPEGKPAKPKSAEFETWDKYEEAQADYFEKLADWKAEQKLSARDQRAESERRQNTLAERWKPQIERSRGAWADYDLVALQNEALKPHIQGSVGEFLTESDYGAEILYKLGEDTANAERIAKLSRVAQFRELQAIEQEFSVAKPKEAKPEARVSKAPPPGRTLTNGAAPPKDESVAAVTAGDFSAFERAENAKERRAGWR